MCLASKCGPRACSCASLVGLSRFHLRAPGLPKRVGHCDLQLIRRCEAAAKVYASSTSQPCQAGSRIHLRRRCVEFPEPVRQHSRVLDRGRVLKINPVESIKSESPFARSHKPQGFILGEAPVPKLHSTDSICAPHNAEVVKKPPQLFGSSSLHPCP